MIILCSILAPAARDTSGLTLNPGGCLSWTIVGLLAGWLAGHLVRGRGFGCLGDLLLGLVGAALGGFTLDHFSIGLTGVQGFFGTLVVAFLGAFVLALLGRLLGGNKTRRYEWRVRFQYPPRQTPPDSTS
jgi:uncharacterized membrane protein YeaQ/YmgE (transglycosylase-associated protein family)